jgi:uncharacterized membrane protein YkoI
MTTRHGLILSAAALFGLTAFPATGHAKAADVKLPDAVKKTFDARFPKAEVEKIDVEEENGVTVYDIEFKDGETSKETDITADGTMLEFTVVIDAKAVPAVAMAPIREAAAGATMTRIERIEISYETRDGKTLKLPQTVTHYAVELKKGDQTAEVVVDADGKVLEPARFGAAR